MPLQNFTAVVAGNYFFTVAGAQGGGSPNGPGGLGATVTATIYLTAGAIVPIIVAGQGASPDAGSNYQPGSGGGGLSAVYTAGIASPTIVAGVPSSPKKAVGQRQAMAYSTKGLFCLYSVFLPSSRTYEVIAGGGGGGSGPGGDASTGQASIACTAPGPMPNGGAGQGGAQAGTAGQGGAGPSQQQRAKGMFIMQSERYQTMAIYPR